MRNRQYIVERMTKAEVALAVDWAAKEGWNPGLHDAACFYATDPQGFFAGKLDGKIIVTGSAVVYDDHFAFCGFYIVDASYRHQGYGLELTQKRLEYVGSRNAGLDGVIPMLDKYARLGYQFAHNNARYQSKIPFASPPSDNAVIPLAQVRFEQLTAYDKRHFPAPRDAFLRCWIKQPGAKSLGYFKQGQLHGYGVIRPCQQGFKIGPLFADNSIIANILLLHLTEHAKGETVYLDIPENNPHAVLLVQKHHMEKVFATARMYLKGQPPIEMEHIYGITTFELG